MVNEIIVQWFAVIGGVFLYVILGVLNVCFIKWVFNDDLDNESDAMLWVFGVCAFPLVFIIFIISFAFRSCKNVVEISEIKDDVAEIKSKLERRKK